jgi:transposase
MAKKKRAKAKHEDPVVEQLDQLKRLVMLQMVVSGVQANQIAKVLGVSKSVISGIVPARLLKKRGT